MEVKELEELQEVKEKGCHGRAADGKKSWGVSPGTTKRRKVEISRRTVPQLTMECIGFGRGMVYP
jgi:hypothetical protein